MAQRVVMCVDVDCFYVQAALINERERGGGPAVDAGTCLHTCSPPVIIAQKNICVTCCYAARAKGVGKLMLLTTARRACPEARVIVFEDLEPARRLCARITACIRAWLDAACPGTHAAMRRLVMEEYYVDLTSVCERLCKHSELAAGVTAPHTHAHTYTHMRDEGDPEHTQRLRMGGLLALALRSHVRASLGVSVSVGVSVSCHAAKLTADVHKPGRGGAACGLACVPVIDKATALDTLAPMPVSALPGVGAVHTHTLTSAGCHTVADVRARPAHASRALMHAGESVVKRVLALAWAEDAQAISDNSPPGSLTDEDSFTRIDTWPAAADKVRELVTSLARRACEHHRVYGQWPALLKLCVRHAGQPRTYKSAPLPATFVPPRATVLAGVKRPLDALCKDVAAATGTVVPMLPGTATADGTPDTEAVERAALHLLRSMLGRSAFHLTLLGVTFTSFGKGQPAAATSRRITDMFASAASASPGGNCAQDACTPIGSAEAPISLTDDDE